MRGAAAVLHSRLWEVREGEGIWMWRKSVYLRTAKWKEAVARTLPIIPLSGVGSPTPFLTLYRPPPKFFASVTQGILSSTPFLRPEASGPSHCSGKELVSAMSATVGI